MLDTLLWLSPTAGDILNTTSQLLQGNVPCSSASLSAALREADSSLCVGVLGDASLRAEFANQLDGSPFEISDATAIGIVDAFAAVLLKRIEAIKSRAEPMQKKLPKLGAMPAFKDVAALLPDGETPAKVLHRDWLLWHAVGHTHSPAEVPELVEGIAHERLAMVLSAGGDPTIGSALGLHVLDNVDGYIAWESSLAGNKTGTATATEVMKPFDEKTAKEVTLRRVFADIFSLENACSLAGLAASGDDVQVALKSRTQSVRDRAVIPFYCAPPAPKEPKVKEPKAKAEAKAEGKAEGKKGGGDAGKPAEQTGGSSAAAGSSFATCHAAMAGHELQWHMLYYQLQPGTALSGASGAAPSATGKAAKAAKTGSPSAAAAPPAGPRPAGFAGTWTPVGDGLPPGHTPYSWQHENVGGMTNAFAKTWAPIGSETPPGHTPYSWEQALGAGTAASASNSATPSSTKPAPKVGGSAKPAAAAPAKPAGSAGAPSEGSNEEALCKLDIRCGRILECSKVPDADTLYLLKVNVGEEQPRQVISSLVKHYKESDLQNRQVVVYCNIKPGKMRGFDSQAMLLAATRDKGSDTERCELLAPPADIPEGCHPMCGSLEVGSLSATQNVKNISKVWGKVQPLLVTNESGEATFEGKTLMMKSGPVKCASLTNVGIY